MKTKQSSLQEHPDFQEKTSSLEVELNTLVNQLKLQDLENIRTQIQATRLNLQAVLTLTLDEKEDGVKKHRNNEYQLWLLECAEILETIMVVLDDVPEEAESQMDTLVLEHLYKGLKKLLHPQTEAPSVAEITAEKLKISPAIVTIIKDAALEVSIALGVGFGIHKGLDHFLPQVFENESIQFLQKGGFPMLVTIVTFLTGFYINSVNQKRAATDIALRDFLGTLNKYAGHIVTGLERTEENIDAPLKQVRYFVKNIGLNIIRAAHNGDQPNLNLSLRSLAKIAEQYQDKAMSEERQIMLAHMHGDTTKSLHGLEEMASLRTPKTQKLLVHNTLRGIFTLAFSLSSLSVIPVYVLINMVLRTFNILGDTTDEAFLARSLTAIPVKSRVVTSVARNINLLGTKKEKKELA